MPLGNKVGSLSRGTRRSGVRLFKSCSVKRAALAVAHLPSPLWAFWRRSVTTALVGSLPVRCLWETGCESTKRCHSLTSVAPVNRLSNVWPCLSDVARPGVECMLWLRARGSARQPAHGQPVHKGTRSSCQVLHGHVQCDGLLQFASMHRTACTSGATYTKREGARMWLPTLPPLGWIAGAGSASLVFVRRQVCLSRSGRALAAACGLCRAQAPLCTHSRTRAPCACGPQRRGLPTSSRGAQLGPESALSFRKATCSWPPLCRGSRKPLRQCRKASPWRACRATNFGESWPRQRP